MPKPRRLKKAIKRLSQVCYSRLLERFQRDDDSSDDSSSDDEDSVEDHLDIAFVTRFRDVCKSRYLCRGKYRRSKIREAMFEQDLQEQGEDGQQPWLTEAEFKQKFQLFPVSAKLFHNGGHS